VEIPEPVRRQAVHPFRELYTPPDVKLVDGPGFTIGVNKNRNAQVVVLNDDGPEDVAAAVEAARAIAREHDKQVLAWWVAPEYDRLRAPLEKLGLVNEDTPGFEAIENGMALVTPPTGEPVEGVDVVVVDSFDQFRAGWAVAQECFGLDPVSEEEQAERFAEYRSPENPGRAFSASIDGWVVGAAYAALGDHGVNLFGGSVVPSGRGRGVYRALTQARWEYAVARGTPALTVQAGRMSKPICERAGFQFVAAVHVYVDTM
jgi:ribosomal protein S18 acetylase RimI-like enzyme